MGNTHSIAGHDCFMAAVSHNPGLVAFNGDPFFHSRVPPLYNTNVPVTPALVTFPETSSQVAQIVQCAAANGYKVQARSGGHSYGNHGRFHAHSNVISFPGLGGEDGAVVVDLRNIQHFSMNPRTHWATVGAGTNLGDLHTRLQNAGGRAVAHGTCLDVGMGGHFTIGGLGIMSREWGLALDHIQEAEVVLANGTIVRANHVHHPEVLFAVKGAAASFGIVTEFVLHTHAVPTHAVQYSYTFNAGNTTQKAQVFKDWQNFIFTKNLTRRVSSELVVSELGIILSGKFFGSLSEWKSFEMHKNFPPANKGNVITLTDWLGMIGSEAENIIQQVGGAIPCSFYAKSMSFTDEDFITDDVVDKLFEYIDSADKDTLAWFIIFDLEAGATNDPPVNATAYAHREAVMWMQSYAINLFGPVSDKTKTFLNSINNVISSSRPNTSYGAYPGYVDPLLPDAQRSYWGANLPRLQQIKAEIDPYDIFHNPQSVQLT
ncbi:hypothetical protein N7462_008469 [Penicillium macrosclerotiorum]|uniref:uncharacterized protein n=1 Tax=Penicillium macrosclerotiorum TaxID=303699 RepID=UPI0025474632|nr:uncharacterized protein N7462_008469 [Penicillium macrosclerotiorum]KAJ5675572.1 hypothetical protein N7462_008469 [Penicillium macrosclerotiorum]